MEQERIHLLIQKYQEGMATDEEKAELNNWYEHIANQQSIFPGEEAAVFNAMLSRLTDEIRPRRRFNRSLLAVAASLLVFSSAGIVFYLAKTKSGMVNATQKMAKDIPPGGNKAILTLADGSKVSLTDAGTGQVALQGDVKLTKTAKDKLLYNSGNQENVAAAHTAYNTIATPAGGQYQVVLPDGSAVWLNALSSIRFPVSFKGLKERRVALTGEAYFEVHHDETQPFKVISQNQETVDLGTGFNIKAYPDEETAKTTLIEGAIVVAGAGKRVLLKPGQQAAVSGKLTVNNVNIQEVIAWKRGYFVFEDAPLETIMQTIARWYNVKVIFSDESLKTETYGAATTRFANISSFLELIRQTGNADFKVEGHTVIVSRKRQTTKP